KAGLAGVTPRDVGTALAPATWSSRFTEPIFWADPNSGIGYFLQVQVPGGQLDSAEQLGRVPVKAAPTSGGSAPVLVRDVADVDAVRVAGQYDRYNMRRVVSLTANLAGNDLGGIDRQIRRVIDQAGDPPRGVQVDVRGQIEPLRELTRGLIIGLGLAVVVILLMLTAYFQSPRLAL